MNTIAAFWNLEAASYHNLWEEDTPAGQLEFTRLQTIFSRHQIAAPGHTVLDVAAGKGAILPFLLPRIGFTGLVQSVDIAPQMLAHVSYHAHAPGRPPGLVCADAHALPYAAAVFDTVVIFNAFPHFADKAAVLQQCARVLKPAAALFILHSQNRAALNAMHLAYGFDLEQHGLPVLSWFVEHLQAAGLALTGCIDTEDIDYFLLKATKC